MLIDERIKTIRFVKEGFKHQAKKFNSLSELDADSESKILAQLKRNSEHVTDCPGSIDPSSIKLLSCVISASSFEKKWIDDKTFFDAYFSDDLYLGTNPEPVEYVFKFSREPNAETKVIETKVSPRGFMAQYM